MATAFDRHVAAGSLQAAMGVLFADLRCFVHDRVRQHALASAGPAVALNQRVAAVLAERMAAHPPSDAPLARDVAAYLKFVHRHWGEFFGGFDGSYRRVVGRAIACRNVVAHQGELDRAAFDDAVDTLARLAEFIAARRGARDALWALARLSSLEAVAATPSGVAAPSSRFVVPVDALALLTPALEGFVRRHLWRAFAASTTAKRAVATSVDAVLSARVEQLQRTLNISAFEANLRFVDAYWSVVFDASASSESKFEHRSSSTTDIGVQETRSRRRALVKHVVALHHDIVRRVAMPKREFDDAVDALEWFAVVFGADKFTTVRLRALLDSGACWRRASPRAEAVAFRRDTWVAEQQQSRIDHPIDVLRGQRGADDDDEQQQQQATPAQRVLCAAVLFWSRASS